MNFHAGFDWKRLLCYVKYLSCDGFFEGVFHDSVVPLLHYEQDIPNHHQQVQKHREETESLHIKEMVVKQWSRINQL